VPVGGAAALDVPLVVTLADQLLALRADWQGTVVSGRRPIRVSEAPNQAGCLSEGDRNSCSSPLKYDNLIFLRHAR
jgi:hypothetical protein